MMANSSAVGRYAPNPDGRSAELWPTNGRVSAGAGRCSSGCADNREMLELAARLGFTEVSRNGEVLVMRHLT
jgi:hypothetical protein